MAKELNPNKFYDLAEQYYAQMKDLQKEIDKVSKQAQKECYKLLSNNAKGNCILLVPRDNMIDDVHCNCIWAIAAKDEEIFVKYFNGEWGEPEAGDRFSRIYEDTFDNDIYLELYKVIVNNLDNAMPFEEAEQLYPKWNDEADEYQLAPMDE